MSDYLVPHRLWCLSLWCLLPVVSPPVVSLCGVPPCGVSVVYLSLCLPFLVSPSLCLPSLVVALRLAQARRDEGLPSPSSTVVSVGSHKTEFEMR